MERLWLHKKEGGGGGLGVSQGRKAGERKRVWEALLETLLIMTMDCVHRSTWWILSQNNVECHSRKCKNK